VSGGAGRLGAYPGEGSVGGHSGGADVANGGPVEHGFPHLETVRAAINALYRRLSPTTV